ncbi:flavin-containing monooxygenase [Rhizodiscina lignyota]|uniref:Flavin-containing monooxygenase n=1 Tax=Rhizodiscina lignyota TaxID=1504668 RepID=A0A9P4M2T2_9PEZI|nr:flavin-containing monooxygenase [Rhizodiscina lignyota]
MKVAVVGAGLSGLSSIKECLTAGFEVEAFEALPHIGGQWAYCDPDPETGEVYSSIYQGVLLNSCRDSSTFSDFPLDPARYPVYFNHKLFLQYIHEFADFWDLKRHIQLNTKVLKCEQLEDGRWKVQRQTKGEEPVENIYDALFACNGRNTYAYTPHFPGKDTFEGQWLHSHYYRTPGPFTGKRVTIIGLGSSAVDIACELAPHAEVHLITRRGGWIIPRFALGKPVEAYDSRLAATVLPTGLTAWAQLFLMNMAQGKHPPELKPNHGIMANAPTVRGEFLERVNVGQIKVHRAGVSTITPTSVTLSTGDTIDSDVIISSTGYTIDFPYLPPNILSLPEKDTTSNPEYKTIDLLHLVKPVHHPNLFIIGLVETAGPAIPVIEAQTRWSVGVLTDKVKLPSQDKQIAEIRKFQAFQREKFVHSDRHASCVMYMSYIDSMLSPLGANPTFGRMLGYSLKNPFRGLSLLNAVYMKIPASAQWRLFGDGKCTDWAAESVLRVTKKLRKEFVAKGFEEMNGKSSGVVNAETTGDTSGHTVENGNA